MIDLFNEMLNEKYEKINRLSTKDIDGFIKLCYRVEKTFGEAGNPEAMMLLSKFLPKIYLADKPNSKFVNRIKLFDTLYKIKHQIIKNVDDQTSNNNLVSINVDCEHLNFIGWLNLVDKEIYELNYSYSDPQDVRIIDFIQNNKFTKINIKCDHLNFYDKFKNKNKYNNYYMNLTEFINQTKICNSVTYFNFENFKSVDIFQLLSKFPNLEYLQLSASSLYNNKSNINFCCVSQINQFGQSGQSKLCFPNLKHLNLLNFTNGLEKKEFIDMIKMLPNLESIFIKFSDIIDDDIINTIISSCDKLTSIKIPNCKNISQNSLNAIVNKFSNLEIFDVSNNYFDENFVIHVLKNLKSLKHFCTGNTGFSVCDKNNDFKMTLACSYKYLNIANKQNIQTKKYVNKELEIFADLNITDDKWNDFVTKIEKESLIIKKNKYFWNWFE